MTTSCRARDVAANWESNNDRDFRDHPGDWGRYEPPVRHQGRCRRRSGRARQPRHRAAGAVVLGPAQFHGLGSIRLQAGVRRPHCQDRHQDELHRAAGAETFTAQAKLTKGQGQFDICEPTADRVANWLEQDFIQPWNEKNIGLEGVEPALLQGAAASLEVVGGKRYLSPSCWGTEAIAFNTQEAPQKYGECSLSALWDPKYEGKVTVRPHSGLLSVGRWLASVGKLPHPLLDTFKDEKIARANFDAMLANSKQLKKNVGQFWKDENSAQGAFRANGCVIGQTWDSSAFQLRQEACRSAMSRRRKVPTPGCRA